ncbi:MAG: YraN family protein [Oscillospiraceae bacterium]
MEKRLIGALGENLVAERYALQGYELLTMNYHSRFGEIDIIAQKGETIVFIEVKTRKNDHFSSAASAVTYAKQQKIKTTALFYLQSHSIENGIVRFDVAEVYSADINPVINIIESAFE